MNFKITQKSKNENSCRNPTEPYVKRCDWYINQNWFSRSLSYHTVLVKVIFFEGWWRLICHRVHARCSYVLIFVSMLNTTSKFCITAVSFYFRQLNLQLLPYTINKQDTTRILIVYITKYLVFWLSERSTKYLNRFNVQKRAWQRSVIKMARVNTVNTRVYPE